MSGDFDDLAVDGDDAGVLVDLRDGHGGQLAPAQAAVGGGVGHQLVAVPVHPGGQRLAELAEVAVRRDLGVIDPRPGLAGHGDLGRGQRAVSGLPVHFRQPGIGQVTALHAGADQGGDHPRYPAAFPGRRGGVDDLLHMAALDVLADGLVDDRGGVQRAQPPLGVRVLTGPPLADREPVGVQVMGDEVGAGPPHIRGVGPEPLGNLVQPGGQLVFAH